MRIKDRIGFSIYRGTFAKPASLTALLALRLRAVHGVNVWRATALVLENLRPTADQLHAIWNRLPSHFERPFFLLHQMKTGGTSIRVAVGMAIELHDLTLRMLINRHGSVENIPINGFREYEFWPFMSGHAHVDAFPESHQGASVFREPRSRYLSHYRQIQRLGEFEPFTERSNSRAGKVLRNIPIQLHAERFQSRDCVWQFTAGHQVDHQAFLANATESEISASLAKGLERLSFAGWTHQIDAFYNQLEAFLSVKIQHEEKNVYESNIDEKYTLTYDDLEFIKNITKRERQLQNLASMQGLLPELSTSESDSLFEMTAKRLNFVLP